MNKIILILIFGMLSSSLITYAEIYAESTVHQLNSSAVYKNMNFKHDNITFLDKSIKLEYHYTTIEYNSSDKTYISSRIDKEFYIPILNVKHCMNKVNATAQSCINSTIITPYKKEWRKISNNLFRYIINNKFQKYNLQNSTKQMIISNIGQSI